MMGAMRLPALATVVVLAVAGLTGCSDEPEPYQDGAQSVPLAGLGSEIDAAGVQVLSPDAPSAASAAEVVAALEDAGLAGASADTDLAQVGDDVAIDGTGTAGLLALAGPGGTKAGSAVVLVFTGPDAAAVFAAADRPVFSDRKADGARVELLSGNLAAYAADASTGARVRTALDALRGAPTP
jgi:hypothetical protein